MNVQRTKNGEDPATPNTPSHPLNFFGASPNLQINATAESACQADHIVSPYIQQAAPAKQPSEASAALGMTVKAELGRARQPPGRPGQRTETQHKAARAAFLRGMGPDPSRHGMPPATLSGHDANFIMHWTYDPEDRFATLLGELDDLIAPPDEDLPPQGEPPQLAPDREQHMPGPAEPPAYTWTSSTRPSRTRDSHAASSPTKGCALRAHLQYPGSTITPAVEIPCKRWPPVPGIPCHPSGSGTKTPERPGSKNLEGVASRTAGKSGSATSKRSPSKTTGSPWISPCRDHTEDRLTPSPTQ